MKNNTLFVSGSGRSGTNITKAILGANSKVGILPFEYRFSIDPNGVIDFYNSYPSSWSPFIASKKIKTFISFLRNLSVRDENIYLKSREILDQHEKGLKLTPYPYHGWELSKVFPGYDNFINSLEEELIDFKYAAVWPGANALVENHKMLFSTPKTKSDLTPCLNKFLNQCVNSFLTKENKDLFVEDNTWSILFADDILELFPNGKILHIVRNPRDVIASMVKQRWTPSDVKDITLYYKSIMDHWITKRNLINPNKVLEIKLEDLITNKEEVIQSICDFANINIEASMLQVDLSKSNSGRYKQQFSSEDIRYIEQTLSDILAIYQY